MRAVFLIERNIPEDHIYYILRHEDDRYFVDEGKSKNGVPERNPFHDSIVYHPMLCNDKNAMFDSLRQYIDTIRPIKRITIYSENGSLLNVYIGTSPEISGDFLRSLTGLKQKF